MGCGVHYTGIQLLILSIDDSHSLGCVDISVGFS